MKRFGWGKRKSQDALGEQRVSPRERAMMICHCNGISDRAIRKAVRNGAETPAEVARACGAGAGCGGCLPAVHQLIHTEAAHRSEAPEAPASTPSTARA